MSNSNERIEPTFEVSKATETVTVVEQVSPEVVSQQPAPQIVRTEQTIIIQNSNPDLSGGLGFGMWGVILGFLGIFFLGFILSPLAFIFGVIGLFKGQIISGFFAILFGVIGILTSAVLMGMLGLMALATI